MKIKIRGSPVFELYLTLDHVAVLLECSAAHYDRVCKAAGQDGAPEPGGFLPRWRRLLSPWPSDSPDPNPGYEKVDAIWSELDICLKILERPPHTYSRSSPTNDAKNKLLAEMFMDFNLAMDIARYHMDGWRVEKPENLTEDHPE